MKTLTITNNKSAQRRYLHVAELSMGQLPKRKFSRNSWTLGDRFIKHCHEMIQLAIESLIMNGVLSCNTHIEEEARIYGLFKRQNVSDFFIYNESQALPTSLGLLEKEIIASVISHPYLTVNEHISNTISAILGTSETYVNPGKVIICKVLEVNLFDYWQYKSHHNWFDSTIKVAFEPSTEASMLSKMSELKHAIMEERICNAEFLLFSDRLYSYIRQKIQTLTDHS